MVEIDDVLVPRGVRALRRPGETLIQAPTPPPTNTPAPTPTPSQTTTSTPTPPPPTKHETQPTKAPTTKPKPRTTHELDLTGTKLDPYRPTIFKTSTKAHPNDALLKAAHRQAGTVAHPVKATANTKPATTNVRKRLALTSRTTQPTSAKKPVHPAAPAPKHPAPTATPTYHTYKKDVHLKPGQTLAYKPGKGYHAREADTSVSRTPAGSLSGAVQPTSAAARPTTKSSTTKHHPVQPITKRWRIKKIGHRPPKEPLPVANVVVTQPIRTGLSDRFVVQVTERLSKGDAIDLLQPTLKSQLREKIVGKIVDTIEATIQDAAHVPDVLQEALSILETVTDQAIKGAASDFHQRYGAPGVRAVRSGTPVDTVVQYVVEVSPDTGYQIKTVEALFLTARHDRAAT